MGDTLEQHKNACWDAIRDLGKRLWGKGLKSASGDKMYQDSKILGFMVFYLSC